ncbi:hypothetical protein SASPL_132213 [Salvia splendens]|uniref:Uncharacterized protein n=1 Tax=Salvia splendens TaxID=180675 RepID=A0A8X8XAQ2_SALSN|nr:hypothetical protein SASPL_132213 [Salvia splendens]
MLCHIVAWFGLLIITLSSEKLLIFSFALGLLGDRLVLREFKVMNPDTNTVRDSTLTTGAALTIALLPSYLRISNNCYKTSSVHFTNLCSFLMYPFCCALDARFFPRAGCSLFAMLLVLLT